MAQVTQCFQQLDYDDQGSWPGICNYGKRQSPINLEIGQLQMCPKGMFLNVEEENAKLKIEKILRNRDYMVNFQNQTLITLTENGQTIEFESEEFHWHQPSQHTINGQQFPLELHIVHKDQENSGRFAVISVLFKLDKLARFNFFDQVDILSESSKVYDFPLQLNDKIIIHYKGSLTTPPCSQVVDWFVYVANIYINEAQLKRIDDRMNNGKTNHRNIQQINGRKAQLLSKECKQANK